MARSRHRKPELAEHKAARKAHRRAVRAANRGPEPTVPGTQTPLHLARQSRRWLLSEHEETFPRFPHTAIREVQKLFHANEAVRRVKAEEGLSAAGQQVLETLEREREESKTAGMEGDWWPGQRKKGVTEAMAKSYAGARRMLKEARDMGNGDDSGVLPLYGNGNVDSGEEIGEAREPVLKGGKDDDEE